MKHIDHPAAMAAQDPDFPEYGDNGWPGCIVTALDNIHEDVVRLREAAATLPHHQAQAFVAIADSFEAGSRHADNYVTEVAGPGLQPPRPHAELGFVKPDTPERVYFYEQDFYVLSNFSAFTLMWKGHRFDTSEAAYHWEKFPDQFDIQQLILQAPSAHEAFKIAERSKPWRTERWDDIKVGVMLDILRAKVAQHEYVHRKLLATGDRELVEDSWRDDFWGWGPNRTGQNMLGKLWMQIRAELQEVPHG